MAINYRCINEKIVIILLLFLFAGGFIRGQVVGDTSSVYGVDGWDPPSSTLIPHYQSIRLFDLLSNPGGWINYNWRAIDSILYETVIYLDTAMYHIQTDTLRPSPASFGTGQFSGTTDADTLYIPDIREGDVVFIQPATAGAVTGLDWCTADVQDSIVVVRREGGVSSTDNLYYYWHWIR